MTISLPVRPALLLLVTCLAACGPSPKRPPNIVLIVADDMGWRDAGYLGSAVYRTPHLDALAASGVVFTQAYANAPNCAPSRAALLSGLYAPRTGVYTVGTSERGRPEHRRLIPTPNRTDLDTTFVTVAEALQRAGYVTGHMGKWHLGSDRSGPGNQGFDVALGGGDWGSAPSHFYPFGSDDRRLRDLADRSKEGDYLTDVLTTQAEWFIAEHADRPFFLYLPYYAVHTPLQAPEALVDRWRNARMDSLHHHPVYAAMLEQLDAGVGSLLALLDSLRIADETIVVIFSDNGGYGPATSNLPLRGAKGMLYEGGIRVPLTIRDPRSTRNGTTVEEPVIGLDLYPTLLDLAGLSSPSNIRLDGVSLAPLLRGGSIASRSLFWHFPAYLEAYRGGVSTGPWRTTPAGAIRSGRYKLIEFFEDGRLELYDLASDLGERENLVHERKDVADSLHRTLVAWRDRVEAPVPTEHNPTFIR